METIKESVEQQYRNKGDLYQIKQAEGKYLTFVRYRDGTQKQISKIVYETLPTTVSRLINQLKSNGFFNTADAVHEYFELEIESYPELEELQVDVSGTQSYKYLIDTLININGDDENIIFNQISPVELQDLKHFVYDRHSKCEPEIHTTFWSSEMEAYHATLEREAKTVDTRLIGTETGQEAELALISDILFVLVKHLKIEYTRLLVEDYADHLPVEAQSRTKNHYQAQAAAERVIDRNFSTDEILENYQVLWVNLFQEYVDYHSIDTLRAKTVLDLTKE